MKELFKIKDLSFYKEEFLDNLEEFEDVLPIIEELSSTLDYEKIEVVDLNDCCEKTKENYIVEIPGFLNEEDEFITRAEVEAMGANAEGKLLDLFVIRIYKCTECNKWIIDILE
ncbi:hypothetical protein [Clostridium sp.]|uniref:hypothetical protein n=1 Tax=Clostridium sp. TaxID=1506 RepID=UPI003F3A4D1B